MNKSNKYHLIEHAIKYIDAHVSNQPTLEDIAEELALSESYIQKLFKEWAGISPKRFLQYLTAQHARQLLEESYSTLETTLETGLSSQGRLYDVTTTVYSMTPGEIQKGGKGLTIEYGFAETPFGTCVIALTQKGICNLAFIDSEDKRLEFITSEWPGANIKKNQQKSVKIISNIFDKTSFNPLTLHLKGSNFQLQVWKALLQLPLGSLSTYHNVAALHGNPNATRATATAIAKNPVAYMIPCHRVIRNTGAFGHYRWNSTRKKAMHLWEQGKTTSTIKE